jgi:acetyltransferase-like isoleucine patch superfamily enzyme
MTPGKGPVNEAAYRQIHDVRIGRNATAGAGAVVVSDVPADTVVRGNPARTGRLQGVPA